MHFVRIVRFELTTTRFQTEDSGQAELYPDKMHYKLLIVKRTLANAYNKVH